MNKRRRNSMEPSWWEDLRFRLFGELKMFYWIYGIVWALFLAFWGTIIYWPYTS